MNLFAAFPFCKLRATPPPHLRRSLHDPVLEGVLDDHPEPESAGCGWFDSSWTLHAGLQITEDDSVDRVVNELPLAWWLAWQPAAPSLAPMASPAHAAST